MPIDGRWGSLAPSDWDDFARAWIAELRGTPVDPSWDVGAGVTQMNFTATAEQQWRFLLAAVAHAESDEEFSHIAAGPAEAEERAGEQHLALFVTRNPGVERNPQVVDAC